jgi:RimJ/RimL family protein N-acetyltransferase
MRSRFEDQEQEERHDNNWDRANNQDDVIAWAASGRDEIIGYDGLFDFPQVAENVNKSGDDRDEGDRCDDSDGEERVGNGKDGE